ncbi:hypothetical protein OROMI_011394 [Orobanche minor]
MESSNDVGKWKAEEAIAGNAEALQALRKLITYPLLHSDLARMVGMKLRSSLLLYGPPGTGKTSLVKAVVRECDAHLIYLSPHDVLQGSHAGERGKILWDAFAEAYSHIKPGKPSVLFIDEIDAICPRRDPRRLQDICVATQLRMLMDSNATLAASSMKVLVVASTNRVYALDPALRRSGRFDAEIEVTTPSEEERLQILKSLLLMEDWKNAMSSVGPSITRGFTVEIPKVSWDDIGGLNDLKEKLKKVALSLKHSNVLSGVPHVRGILLHGPPGCSQTILAKAAAHAAQASFFYLREWNGFGFQVHSDPMFGLRDCPDLKSLKHRILKSLKHRILKSQGGG